MDDLIESGERARGYHCWRCGGPLYWLHSRRFDAGMGEATYARAYVPYRDPVRRTRADRELDVPAGRSGHEVRTRTVYERRLELVCPRCHIVTSRAQAGQGDPRPPAPDQQTIDGKGKR